MRSLVPLLLLALCASALYAATFPPKPDSEHWFTDQARMLSVADARAIDEICSELWKSDKIPIYVVTIESMASFEHFGTIEDYAFALFNEWGIGSKERNSGMLLVVSRKDRKARIELGADWGHRSDQQAQQVMNEQIVPRFKQDLYSEGILAGVRGMEALARDLELPAPYRPWYIPVLWIGAIILLVGVGISLIRSGQKGWGWALIAAAGVLLFFLIRAAASNSGSGGGFGGGSSGGGGATGSW